MAGKSVLVVDDDVKTVELVKLYLNRDGHKVLVAYDGVEALRLAREGHPDLMVLDLMLPGIDGFEVCRTLRAESDMPIIMLTARTTDEDKIDGLGLGADDYVTKPFSSQELITRVMAVLRRAKFWEEHSEPVFSCNDLVLDYTRRRVMLAGGELDLTATEYRLLPCLAHNAEHVMTPDQLLERVWGEEYIGETHLLQVNMARLRQKLGDDAKNPKYILTRAGIGYVMKHT